MSTYRTPDVYIEEISTLPPSVAEVSTAIPAFLGYTEKVIDSGGTDLTYVPTRINTMLDFIAIFGKQDNVAFKVTTQTVDSKVVVSGVALDAADQNHRLYYALDHFFKNGGGSCYIVSLGTYKIKANEDFEKGLAALKKEDEPTLLVLSEATTLSSTDYYPLCQAALDQCADLKDRFCILDVLESDTTATAFRTGITNNLKYGAAYFPYLNTSINFQFEEDNVFISAASVTPVVPTTTSRTFTYTDATVIGLSYSGAATDAPSLEIIAGTASGTVTFSKTGNKLTITNVGANGKAGSVIETAWAAWTEGSTSGFALTVSSATNKLVPLPETPLTITPEAGGDLPAGVSQKLSEIKNTNTGLYNTVKLELLKQRVTLPPSPAVAGVYATVDRSRGVWKAPANVGLNNVISPTVKITAQEQDLLNVDDNSGKSINAIRTFVGKGTLIWGARTLAGNDNEWRYVPVRRLFNMIEESSKKASAFAVFEPNDASTWLKVKGMLESYLYGLWQAGALAGSKADSAYYVHVGLGKTMSTQDILEGRMIIEIGIAAVRPAEFIILRFSHKLQEA